MATAVQTQREYVDTALLTKEQRTALESFWKGGFHKGASLTHHLLYAMLRGKDWRKAATPPTNAVKVENGALTGWCFWKDYGHIHLMGGWAGPYLVDTSHHTNASRHSYLVQFLEPWEGHVTEEMLQSLHTRIPHPSDVRVAMVAANSVVPWWEGYHATWACPTYLDAASE